MKPSLLATALASTILATGAAHATLQIAADINGTPFSCADQAACDTNPAVGQLQIANQTIAGVEFLGSAQTQVTGPSNSLNTSSFQVVNTNLTPAPIQLAISGTDFLGPVTSFAASGSGTWQNANTSSVDLTFWADPADDQGADTPTDLPGSLLATISSTAVGSADSFNQSFTGAFSAAGPYSMSEGTSGTLAAWDGLAGDEPTLVGRSQTLVAVQGVSEPSTLALFGVALLSLATLRAVRQQQG